MRTNRLPTQLCPPLVLALIGALLAPLAGAQEPLFTFAQVSDSQPQTTAENQRFVDVLRTISEAGQPGKILPRRVDLVLFAGDITWGNTRSEWVAARQKLDAWLTANDIPFLAVPGNHDVDNSDTSLYEEFIADSGVWERWSDAFTGHNGESRSPGWKGLRFIGVNNSNPGWNTIPSADVAAVASRVDAAQAAHENAFILCHHPHNEKSRMPLSGVLPKPAMVGYLHGHLNDPLVRKGLSGVTNPNIYDCNTNAIYDDRCLIYYEVFPTQLRAHVLILDDNPTTLPAPTVIPLVHPMVQTSAPGIGFAGPQHVQARPEPTGNAPERKLWHHADAWWSVLWSDSAAAYRIHRLSTSTQTWTDTGPTVSSSAGRSFDALPTGSALALASNVATTPGQTAGGSPGQLHRFTYDGGIARYVADAGFPVTISDACSPTLVLARDTQGVLWAAWTRGGAVFVAHSVADDGDWSAPLTLATGLGSADSVCLVALDGQVGALWSNVNDGTVRLALHADGDPDDSWASETATAQASLVGSALDAVAWQGRVLAAVEAQNGALNLLERSLSGTWTVHALAQAEHGLHDPLLVVDDAFDLLRLYATGPTLTGQSVSGGGAIFEKVAPLATLAFPPGRGTPIVQDGLHPSGGCATAARSAVTSATGLVVLGSVTETERYWHAHDSLAAAPAAPTADFNGTPRVGPVPLTVDFSDVSTGAPTHWSWDFGDGAIANVKNPQHVYTQVGSYTVTLRAANGGGENERVRTAYVVVEPPPNFLTFRPVADTRVYQGSPSSTSGGTVSPLRVKSQSGSSYQSFVRFDLGTLSGPVSSVKLRLFCTDASSGGGSVYRITSNTWGETTTSWNNKPALPATPLASFGTVFENTWHELELGPAAVSSGLVSLALAGGTSNSAYWASREAVQKPELVVTFSGAPVAPIASFSGTPLAGGAPLTVAFTDTSTGMPTAWTWTFGDGGTSSQRNPSHLYGQPGVYTVSLAVSNATGNDALTRTDYVTVTEAPPPPPIRTFLPIADARVNEGSPSSKAGSDVAVRVRQESGGSYHTYVRFDLSTLTGSVVSARLRLFATDGSNVAGTVYPTSGAWTEAALMWSNRPGPTGALITTTGTVANNAWAEFDVTSAVTPGGQLNLVLQSTSSNSCYYSSREGAQPPELVVTTAAP